MLYTAKGANFEFTRYCGDIIQGRWESV